MQCFQPNSPQLPIDGLGATPLPCAWGTKSCMGYRGNRGGLGRHCKKIRLIDPTNLSIAKISYREMTKIVSTFLSFAKISCTRITLEWSKEDYPRRVAQGIHSITDRNLL